MDKLDKDLIMIMKYRKENKVAKTVRLPEPLAKELNEFANESPLTEQDVIICAIKNYIDSMK